VYYQGLWHYLCHEKSHWRWLLQRIPCVPQVMGRLHHRWANRATYSNRDFLRDTTRAFKKRLGNRAGPLLSLARPLARVLTPRRSQRLLAAAKAGAVDGYWGDNWVSQTLVVKLKDSPGGEHIHWTGIAAEPMELSVAVQGQPIGVFPLQGGQAEDS